MFKPAPAIDPPRQALVGLRAVVALLLIAHGVARAVLGIVDDFGVFLTAVGFPLGTALAWAVTAAEIAGGSILAAGRRSLEDQESPEGLGIRFCQNQDGTLRNVTSPPRSRSSPTATTA